jgi:hypothetical protein
MTARTTCADLIAELRGMTDAGTGDYSIGTVAYWSDIHLQTVLDHHRDNIYSEQLRSVPANLNGTIYWKDYYSSHGNLETTDGGTAVFYLQDAAGTILGTALYTPDYARGEISFASDTAGSAVFMTARAFDLNGAAAEVWQKKMSNAARMYDFSTDNHSFKRSQFMDHCKEMIGYYEALADPTSIQIYRGDMFYPEGDADE